MAILLALTRLIGVVNGAVLKVGLWVGSLAIALMLASILVQVFCRYVLGDALAWSEEAARFLMLWMMAALVPTAFRQGGFVAIEMISDLLPRPVAAVLNLMFLCLSALILWTAMRIGWAEVTGIGGRFALPSLQVPVSLTLDRWASVPRGWMTASLATAVTLMFVVNIELLLRAIARVAGAGKQLPPLRTSSSLGAE
ncbi:TRAP transporter small permease subunit [Microvirga tunisiensis]|uniref:TRAP transporter small permease protein n=2 Tax=Pannonibacter tanglangensis TaxID=2750084 RepID=A0A7X5F0L2_9HYPH|nr:MULTISPECIES: TRAP transporter small permease subunit [unclassified Pannonibacter]NBN63919.1 TRAP transporter small permease subunit [Pannonibacter sp. XCT-34]NBN77556.1 TRAP transporter small permease subunit [Pannonibacter sp. XCT-53]